MERRRSLDAMNMLQTVMRQAKDISDSLAYLRPKEDDTKVNFSGVLTHNWSDFLFAGQSVLEKPHEKHHCQEP